MRDFDFVLHSPWSDIGMTCMVIVVAVVVFLAIYGAIVILEGK